MSASHERSSGNSADDEAEASYEADFVEQAEYLREQDFTALSATHPDEESIVRRLSAAGAKLLVGPRGCGKTTLMLKAYYSLLRDGTTNSLPVYVNFKLSLKLEPLYVNTPNATYWFRQWLVLKVYEGLLTSIREREALELSPFQLPLDSPTSIDVATALRLLEQGKVEGIDRGAVTTVESFVQIVSEILASSDLQRCILLMDDAAHAFSPRQQEDFFDFFREIKSREIAPKAAIYPGITTYSPNFHVGHDAELIDAWVRPDRPAYLPFMRSLAEKRFRGALPKTLENTTNALEFLSFASFGIPRSFLNMLRTLYQDKDSIVSGGTLDRRKVLDAAKISKEAAHNVFDSLATKLPAYREFVSTGNTFYFRILEILKRFNQPRPLEDQATEIGLKRPLSPELERVVSFFQYAGLLMPAGENSRGVKGVFDLYLVHFGDLITENAVVGRKTKVLDAFVQAFSARTTQTWPRISHESVISPERYPTLFRLTLPHCQSCGTERINEQARFCHNCGAQLKTASLYDQLTNQDISVLPISRKMVSRIKRESPIRTVKDILIDNTRTQLRRVGYIGPIRSARIVGYAEEHVA